MIISGITQAMHYCSDSSQAFDSVEHIMRSVNNGWLIRFIHANGAGFFFIFVYIHIARGLFFGSFRKPRQKLWTLGVIIYLVMMAFTWDQDVLFFHFDDFLYCQLQIFYNTLCSHMEILISVLDTFQSTIYSSIEILIGISSPECIIFWSSLLPFSKVDMDPKKRIGPHSLEILSQIFGSMLGNGSAKFKRGTSFRFPKISNNMEYLAWFHNKIFSLGYCKEQMPETEKTIGEEGRPLRSYNLKTFNFTSFNWILNSFYDGDKKRVPEEIGIYLTPLALAIWAIEMGQYYKGGFKLIVTQYELADCQILIKTMKDLYDIEPTIHKTRHVGRFNLFISRKDMSKFISIVEPYYLQSMRHKLYR